MYLAEEQTVLVGEKQRHVRLAKTDRPTFFVVEVDDKRYNVELINKSDKNNHSFTIKVDGKQYKISLMQNENKTVTINVDGRNFTIKKETAKEKQLKAELAPMIPQKETVKKLLLEKGAIIASLPGKVVAIKVKKDDKVNAGDVLCILESMKMENEIAAQKDGVVKEILISEGVAVNKGDVMFIVE